MRRSHVVPKDTQRLIIHILFVLFNIIVLRVIIIDLVLSLQVRLLLGLTLLNKELEDVDRTSVGQSRLECSGPWEGVLGSTCSSQ